MEQIYPLREEHISRYCGMPVCAVMKSGYRYVGTLASSRNGSVHLDIGLGSPYHPFSNGPGASFGETTNSDAELGPVSTSRSDLDLNEAGSKSNEQYRTNGTTPAGKQKKKKKLKTSSGSSLNKYEKKVSNPAPKKKNDDNSGIISLSLQDILFLVRIV